MTKTQVIGSGNKLPWHIKEELQYFKKLTLHKPVIMGSNTFRSINLRPLANRSNIVITSNQEKLTEEIRNNSHPDNGVLNNLIFVNNVKDSLLKAQEFYNTQDKFTESKEIMIIGGNQIYRQFLPLTSRLYLSIIKKDYDGDIFFPVYDQTEWKLQNIQDFSEFIAQIWHKVILE